MISCETSLNERNQPGQELLNFPIYICIIRMICHNFVEGICQENHHAQKITGLINSKHYLDAARKLEDFRTPTNLARDLAGIFLADKLEQKVDNFLQKLHGAVTIKTASQKEHHAVFKTGFQFAGQWAV